MKTKTILRIVGIIMLMAMLLTVFASCKKNEEGAGADESAAGADAVSTDDNGETSDPNRYDKNGYLMDDLPEDLRYNGQEISVLAWNDSSNMTEFNVKEITDNEIDNSVYMRDQTIQARLGITLKYEMTPGSVKKIQEYKKVVQNAYTANMPYDIIATYTRSAAICASAGFLQDFGAIENSYIDLDKPWWSAQLMDATKTSTGKYYVLTGDASTCLVQMAYCIYFNADMISNNKLESPYTLVENNQWTIEKMKQMTKGVYDDKGSKANEPDIEDTLGIIGDYFAWPALLHGCGVAYTEKDAAGDFVLTSAIKGDKAINLMKDFNTWVQSSEAYVAHSEKRSGDYPTQNFKAGNSMFCITESGSGLKHFMEAGFEVGVVPCPKYDTDQEEYYSTIRQPVTFFAIMDNVSDDRLTMLSAVLECWGSEGYRQTTPVIYEQSMKYKGTASPKIPVMLDLIKSTAWFDCARIYAEETQYLVDKPGYYLFDGKPWENYVNGDLKQIESAYLPMLNLQLNKAQ